MKRYRNYRAKKLRLPRKLIFFSAVAVAILLFTLILGNILKSNLENASIDTTDILSEKDPASKEPEKEKPVANGAEHDKALAEICASTLIIPANDEDFNLTTALGDLKAQGFNAVSINIFENSNITYASPALEKLTRMPSSESLIPYDTLCNAVTTAKDMGLRVSCIFQASESLCDEIVAEELFEMGFDEIIIRGFEKYTQLDNELVSVVNSYVERFRAATSDKMSIGVCFDETFYQRPANAPYIEKVYTSVNFLAIDMTDISADEIPAIVGELQGSSSAYLLRALFDSNDSENAETIKTQLKEQYFIANQFIKNIRDEETTDQ